MDAVPRPKSTLRQVPIHPCHDPPLFGSFCFTGTHSFMTSKPEVLLGTPYSWRALYLEPSLNRLTGTAEVEPHRQRFNLNLARGRVSAALTKRKKERKEDKQHMLASEPLATTHIDPQTSVKACTPRKFHKIFFFAFYARHTIATHMPRLSNDSP